MNVLSLTLLVAYSLVVLVICAYGAHRYWIVWQCLRPAARREADRDGRFEVLPRVTVQLPMYNERRVAERVIEAACAIDYPAELLQIQVLDDSTDESADIARRCCERMRAAGHDVDYRHRTDRSGYKAGALAAGTDGATGEFLAVFDADFVPPPGIIRDTIHHFTDERVGMVQTRWSHLNRHDSLLTEIQAMFLDGHFVVEQAARSASGRWFNFNGTAGVWRRSCIESAGGWQHDTLTEDTDLSYRAQLEGWDFTYLNDVCCPAELPPTVPAFLSQQHRWNKGLIQTAIKLLPRILRSNAPWSTKLEAWFHLTSPLVHAIILLLVLLAVPALFVALPLREVNPGLALAIGSTFLLLGAMAACTFYVASQCVQGRSAWQAIIRMPALMAYGVGISVVNTKAVVEACLGHESPFVRTPKFNGSTGVDLDPVLADRSWRLPQGVIELVLGAVMLGCFALTFARPFTLVGAPFLLMFGLGYLAIGLPALRQRLTPAKAPAA